MQQIRISDTIPEIPHRVSAHGPVQSRLRRRALLAYLLLAALGSLPVALHGLAGVPVPVSLQVFGLGVWFPGAAFLALGVSAWWMAALAFSLFVLLRVGWSLTGMLALPVAGWLLPALIAAMMAGEAVSADMRWIPLVALTIAAASWLREAWTRRWRYARAQRRRAFLPQALQELDQASVAEPDPNTRELTPEALAAARYVFDLALQPVGQFEGFSRRDNFQLAALRYQLNYISYGLAMMQCHYTPNFHGYLSQAQRYAIESLTRPEVCGYWKWESRGSFRLDVNPAGRDNVMLTGWSLVGITAYAANTGDTRYEQPGSLVFKPFHHGGKTFPHDSGSFIRSLLTNWRSAPYTMYPCEPYWTFPLCNAFGICGVIPYDRQHGTQYMTEHFDTMLTRFEQEFLFEDGDMVPMRSDLTGLDFATRTLPPQFGMLSQLSVAIYFNALHAGHARRAYAIARHESLRLEEGRLDLGIPVNLMLDVGDYSINPCLNLALVALAAHEQGDEQIAQAALREAEAARPRRDAATMALEDVSCATNVMLATARWARRNDWRHLINRGPQPGALKGPLLTECRYPDVLVARAISDGSNLELVLYNGADAGLQSLAIERLQPGGEYRRSDTGESLHANSNGCAVVDIHLDGRTELTLQPVGVVP
ncbi:MAG: hypothetical protein P1U78_08825 [Alcanivoracaceae bacterium]|nr:hypothetical protein [Alcanivoracaceae bacterium]